MLFRTLTRWTALKRWTIRPISSPSSSGSADGSDKSPPSAETEDPIRRTINVFADQFRQMSRGKFEKPESEIYPTFCDVAIIGGGIMGCSIAYWLKQRASDALNVAVIERDPTYTRASTGLSVGGLRQQFSLPENIQMSMFGAEFLRTIKKRLSVLGSDPPDVRFSPHGYLFLASADGAEALNDNYKVQKDLGAHVELLSAAQLNRKFPWLHTEDVVLGCHGLANEGWFDPWMLLGAFKQKALSLGVKFVKGEVDGFTFKKLPGLYETPDAEETRRAEVIDKIVVKEDVGRVRTVTAAIVILAAGYDSGTVGKMARMGVMDAGPLRHPVPVEPRKRYVYVFNCQQGPGLDMPMLIDPTGTYCRREGLGGNFLAGRSPAPGEEPDCNHLDVDYSFFEKQVWPNLALRVPCFEAIKLKSAWAGFYDYNTFDQNGIIGFHPHHRNLCLATGFSGHGIQQAPAVGRAIMELIVDGGFQTIDLSRFSFNRIIEDQPIYERNIV